MQRHDDAGPRQHLPREMDGFETEVQHMMKMHDVGPDGRQRIGKLPQAAEVVLLLKAEAQEVVDMNHRLALVV